MKYYVEVHETLVKMYEVAASSPDEAKRIVEAESPTRPYDLLSSSWYVDSITDEGGATTFTEDMGNSQDDDLSGEQSQ